MKQFKEFITETASKKTPTHQYDVHRYVGYSNGRPQYDEYNTGFPSKKHAIDYAEKNKTLQEKGYKIVKTPYRNIDDEDD